MDTMKYRQVVLAIVLVALLVTESREKRALLDSISALH